MTETSDEKAASGAAIPIAVEKSIKKCVKSFLFMLFDIIFFYCYYIFGAFFIVLWRHHFTNKISVISFNTGSWLYIQYLCVYMCVYEGA